MTAQKPQKRRTLVVLVAGACLGAVGYASLTLSGQQAKATMHNSDRTAVKENEQLEAVERKLPDQSHVMQDVSYHFSNLWFAGKHKNWALADFYLSETRSHLHWAVRIIPVRKDKAGREIKLAEILQALENDPLKQLKDAIVTHDEAAFEKAYRFTLEGCYGCHKAADKPYLRPQIPTRPETPIINFDPNADWPE